MKAFFEKYTILIFGSLIAIVVVAVIIRMNYLQSDLAYQTPVVVTHEQIAYHDSVNRVYAVEDSINKAAHDKEDSIYKHSAKYIAQQRKDSIAHEKIAKIQREYNCTEAQAEAIKDHSVILGMSKSMAIAAWGKPYDINKSQGVNYEQEQWVYSMKSYLYFDGNGVLKFIQN